MSGIEVLPVRSRREKRTFLTFPWRIFKDDPLWVPPLLPDLIQRTDPGRGVFFQHGTAEFFIAWQEGRPVGTICAAQDRQANLEGGWSEAIFGFFHFIEDYRVMEALLSELSDWGTRAPASDTDRPVQPSIMKTATASW